MHAPLVALSKSFFCVFGPQKLGEAGERATVAVHHAGHLSGVFKATPLQGAPSNPLSRSAF
jgi:hypothetical protein